MGSNKYRDDLIPQDTAEDDSSFGPGTSQPLSEAEIEDLLYGEGRSIEERLQLLRALRDDLTERDPGDIGEIAEGGDNDPAAVIQEINGRIAELEGEVDDQGGVAYDVDPLAHRETLAPDSDELEELEEDDEESLEEEDEWLDSEDDEDEPPPTH